MEEDLIRIKQERKKCQDYIDKFEVQNNSKIVKLDIEREELWRAMAKVAYLETIVRVRERSNEALATSNKVLIANNTLFHDKKRQMIKQIEQMIKGCNNRLPRLEIMLRNTENTWVPSLFFFRNITNRGDAFLWVMMYKAFWILKVFKTMYECFIIYERVKAHISF